TPSGTVAGPLKLIDPIDAALKITTVTVNGQVVPSCGAQVMMLGPLSVTCGLDGRTVEVDAPQLAQPLTVQIAATILPTAGAQIANVATLTDAMGGTQS